jgi:hypothetical protein
MRRVLLAALAVVLVLPASGGPGSGTADAAGFAAHPRIFLTPAKLTSLRGRAAANDALWIALRDQCDTYLTGHVEWPDGSDYPDTDSIGEGYQGDGYLSAVANLGLCYRVVQKSNKTKANAYAAKGADVLNKMSAPYGAGQHGENPLGDSGYGVRNYPLAMALGFDWFYPKLSSALKTRLDASILIWLKKYRAKGFEHDFPQGNYFAGYYNSLAMAGLALSGDASASHGAELWTLWRDTIHGAEVQPYYAANLRGGGWPEGWNYGPRGTLNMSWPVLAAKTALGADLVHAAGAKYTFPLTSARYLLYFTWPNLRTLEDSGWVYEGDNPTATQPSFFAAEAGLLEAFDDPLAAKFHSFARAVRKAEPDESEPQSHYWENFLFWDPAAPAKTYKTLPLSYLARGLDRAAVRSSWATDAVWAAFFGGPHVNFPDAAEQLPDKGSLTIVRGGRPLLVNSWAALVRNTPGTEDGAQYYTKAQDNVIYGNRDILNIFYARPTPIGQGTYLRREGNRSRMGLFEDGGSYVAMRADYLADNYPQYGDPADKSIVDWSREVVYLRPNLFVVYDRTSVAKTGLAQWLAFHVGGRAYKRSDPAPGVHRFDVGQGAKFAGAVEMVLPAGHGVAINGLFGTHKVDQLKITPPNGAKENRWLTVFEPATSPEDVAAARPLTAAAGNVIAGDVLGVLLDGPGQNFVVLMGAGSPASTVAGTIRYVVLAAKTRHVISDLAPNTDYSITVQIAAGKAKVTLQPGAGVSTSGAGVLSFTTAADGSVAP